MSDQTMRLTTFPCDPDQPEHVLQKAERMTERNRLGQHKQSHFIQITAPFSTKFAWNILRHINILSHTLTFLISESEEPLLTPKIS